MKTLRAIIATPYKGRNYMVIEGSERHLNLQLAESAWRDGNPQLATDYVTKALDSLGCPFEAREMSSRR